MYINHQPSKDFTAIDVEYADREQNICQVGLAVVRNLEIVERRSWLIQPPDNHYDELQMRIHGITPKDTEISPTFEEVWLEIRSYLLTGELWAHNAASAEQPVLEKNLRQYGFDASWLDIRDSRDLYQRPDCQANRGNGLEQCCMALGIPCEQHHDALSDAVMCARIVIAAAKGVRPCWDGVPVSSEELRKQKQDKRVLRLGEFTEYYASTSSGEEDVLAVLTSTYEGAPEQQVDVWDKGDPRPGANKGRVELSRLNTSPDNPLYGKTVVPTGSFLTNREELKEAIRRMGAIPGSSVTGNTYAVIIGTKGIGPKKLINIEKQEAKGHHLFRIVGDEDLNTLLYGDGRKFFT